MESVLLSSESSIKREVVIKLFPSDRYILTCKNCDECKLPAQPVNCAEQCAKTRLDYAKKRTFPTLFDYYISIENGIEIDDTDDDEDVPREICVVFIEHKGLIGYSGSDVGFSVPQKYYQRLSGFSQNLQTKIQGYNVTIGDLMHNDDTSVDSKNWIKKYHGTCRSVQIELQLNAAKINLAKSLVTAQTLSVKCKMYSPRSYGSEDGNQKYGSNLSFDLMRPDLFSVIRCYSDIEKLLYLIVDRYRFNSVDYVIGIGSSGFLGFGLACALSVGFIPIRKCGKLPGKVSSLTYNVGTNVETIEVPSDIPVGCRVLIFDDLIETGTSLKAACDIIASIGCTIIDCVVVKEIYSLREEAVEKMGQHYTVILKDWK